MIISVAMDSDIDAARPWLEQASPDYVTLIDQDHRLSALYNMVNVPQAVWIDEDGIIVRPTETGGSLDVLRHFDPKTLTLPEDIIAKARATKATYVDAVRDWAINGANSKHLLDRKTASERVPAMTNDMAMAHAFFQLGQYLKRDGRTDEAARAFEASRQLHPTSWNIYRQTIDKMPNGIAAGEGYWQKVMALGDDAYYAPIDMDGMEP